MGRMLHHVADEDLTSAATWICDGRRRRIIPAGRLVLLPGGSNYAPLRRAMIFC
jgi:hypothetical protein